MRGSTRWYVVSLVCLLAAGFAAAQEPAAGAPEYPLGYVIMHEVDAEMGTEYWEVANRIAEAMRTHDNAVPFWTWTHATGGPGYVYYWVAPMKTFGDIDGWTSIPRMVSDVYGSEEAQKIWQALAATGVRARNMVLGTATQLSNLEPEGGEFPKFGYYWHVTVERGMIPQYAEIMRKIAAAHRDHPDGLHWETSRCLIGEQDPEFFIFIGMNDWGELANMPNIERVLVEKYGQDETTALFKQLSQISSDQANLMMLVPELSNLPPSE